MEQSGRFFVTGDAWKEEIPILFLANAVFFTVQLIYINALTKCSFNRYTKSTKIFDKNGPNHGFSSGSLSLQKKIYQDYLGGHWIRKGKDPKDTGQLDLVDIHLTPTYTKKTLMVLCNMFITFPYHEDRMQQV